MIKWKRTVENKCGMNARKKFVFRFSTAILQTREKLFSNIGKRNYFGSEKNSSTLIRRPYPLLTAKTKNSGGFPHEEVAVVQYNILAGTLGTPAHFPYVDPKHLAWSYRREKIFEQIHDMLYPELPDFICLEELSDYWTYFQKRFLSIGLDSVYIRRPSSNPSSWSGSMFFVF